MITCLLKIRRTDYESRKINGTYLNYSRLQATWKVENKLSDILLLTICAVIPGTEGKEDIQGFGNAYIDFLKQYDDIEHGIPVHDALARVVACIYPKNTMSASLAVCGIVIHPMMVMLFPLMVKHFIFLMIRGVAGVRFI